MFPRLLRAVLVAGLVFTLGGAAQTLPAEPANLYPVKQALRAYVDSGSYAKSIAEVALQANKYLVKRIAKGAKPGKKLAIVFDIDETTLSNLSHILGHDFGYMPKDWDTWVVSGRAPAIIPVQTIYDTAVRGKVDVFFITGRGEEQRSSTERNLRDVGYDTWARIYFKPATDKELTTRGFKVDTRRMLEQQGYVIIANVGDQDSDLLGGYAERWFKLPNPFYIMK
ncbi:MAG: HAD family acid phosphatase [bacterium]|nr:HAD family acid phosphatase [bacterium]